MLNLSGLPDGAENDGQVDRIAHAARQRIDPRSRSKRRRGGRENIPAVKRIGRRRCARAETIALRVACGVALRAAAEQAIVWPDEPAALKTDRDRVPGGSDSRVHYAEKYGF